MKFKLNVRFPGHPASPLLECVLQAGREFYLFGSLLHFQPESSAWLVIEAQ